MAVAIYAEGFLRYAFWFLLSGLVNTKGRCVVHSMQVTKTLSEMVSSISIGPAVREHSSSTQCTDGADQASQF